MDFFGLTYLGPSRPIRDMLRPGCGDPETPAEVPGLLAAVDQQSTCPKESGVSAAPQQVCVIDCYVGRADGFAYGSEQRLRRMRARGLRKPLAPPHQYRRPPTTATEYGWWLCDPALAQAQWPRTSPRRPRPVAPYTKVLDIVRKNNKYASLF